MTAAGFDPPAVTAAEEVALVLCAVDGAGACAWAVNRHAAANVPVNIIAICFIVRLSGREYCILVANRSSAGKLIVKALQRGGETPIPQPYPRILALGSKQEGCQRQLFLTLLYGSIGLTGSSHLDSR